MNAAPATFLAELPTGPEGQDWVRLLAQGGLLTAALDGLGDAPDGAAAPVRIAPAVIVTCLGRLFLLAGFRGAGAGGGGPGPRAWVREGWA